MADAQASGACGRKIVWVQVPFSAARDFREIESPFSFLQLNVEFIGIICYSKQSLMTYIVNYMFEEDHNVQIW